MQTILGEASLDDDKLKRNFAAVLDEINRAKPSSAKGRYIKGITVSSTMGPGVQVDPNASARDLTPQSS